MPSINFEIRQLVDSDAKMYRTVRLFMLNEMPQAFSLSSYEEALKEDISYFLNLINKAPIFGVFDDDVIVGTAGYFIQPGEKLNYKAYIWGVYLKPKYRGKGLSRSLMNHIMADIPSSVELVQLNVIHDSVAAVGLYKSIGFEEFGYEKKSLRVGERYYDQLHMVKFLK